MSVESPTAMPSAESGQARSVAAVAAMSAATTRGSHGGAAGRVRNGEGMGGPGVVAGAGPVAGPGGAIRRAHPLGRDP